MRTAEKIATKWAGAVRGVLAGINEQGEPLVDFCGNAGGPVVAISTISVRACDAGREAILLFEDSDPARPLLIGLVQLPTSEVRVDQKRLVLSADEEVTIRCGEASITLTRAGKVSIKGTSLLSKSSGPNRVKGGSVELN